MTNCIFPKTRGNKNKQWTHITLLKSLERFSFDIGWTVVGNVYKSFYTQTGLIALNGHFVRVWVNSRLLSDAACDLHTVPATRRKGKCSGFWQGKMLGFLARENARVFCTFCYSRQQLLLLEVGTSFSRIRSVIFCVTKFDYKNCLLECHLPIIMLVL